MLPGDDTPEVETETSSAEWQSFPQTPASFRGQLQRQSSRCRTQQFEALYKVKMSALVEGCATLDIDFPAASPYEMEGFLMTAVRLARSEGAGSVTTGSDASTFAELLCSLAPDLLAVDSNFVDLACHCPAIDPAIRQERLAGAPSLEGQKVFSSFLCQYYRPAIYSIVAAADMTETLALAKEAMVFARARSRTNDRNQHYLQAWQAANARLNDIKLRVSGSGLWSRRSQQACDPTINSRLECLSSWGQLSDPPQNLSGVLADYFDSEPEANPLDRKSMSSLLSLSQDPNQHYLQAAKVTIRAIEKATKAASTSSLAVVNLQRFLALLPEEQMVMLLAAWRSYVADAVLFAKWVTGGNGGASRCKLQCRYTVGQSQSMAREQRVFLGG